MHSKAKYSQGVALILVLMITVVMAVIMLYMSGQGQNNARLGGIIKQHTNAKLNVETAQAELVFSFMTTPFGLVGPTDDFQGQPIENSFVDSLSGQTRILSKYKVKAQDISGLVSLMPFNKKDFIRLITTHGVPPSAIPRILDRLDDWQDIDSLTRLEGAEKGDYSVPNLPKNGVIQSSKELIYILEDEVLYKQIKPYLTLYANDFIVRQFMPKSLYSALGITQSGSQDTPEENLGYPSGRFVIEITTDKNVSITKRFILLRGQDSFRPYFITDDELIFK